MAFNIEFRPITFEEVIGNRDTVESLQSLLEQENPPRAYLFFGPMGCGKTTLARILAKEFGCSDFDIIELNSANMRGIDTSRDIISQINYKPLNGKCKAYIMDEIQQTTKDAQSALLKAVEECPAHCLFIFCTTDPQKIIPTLKSRCAQYGVQKLSVKAMSRLLKNILGKKTVSENILGHICEESEGIPRNALIMLQQIIDIKDEEKAIKIIQSVKTDEKQIIDLCRALNELKQWKAIAEIIKGIEAEPESIRRAVLGYFTSVALNSKDKKNAMRAMMIIENFTEPYYDSGKAGLILSAFRSIME